jgi:hypothetical protein
MSLPFHHLFYCKGFTAGHKPQKNFATPKKCNEKLTPSDGHIFFFYSHLGLPSNQVQLVVVVCSLHSLPVMPQFAAQRRSIFTNFPIPFDHPYTVPALIAALSTSSLIYYYLSASHDAELREAQRRRDLQKRKSMKRPEDRFASMKVSSGKSIWCT